MQTIRRMIDRVQSEREREIRNSPPAMGPVHWCEECLDAPVVFDWRRERQICPRCEAKGAA